MNNSTVPTMAADIVRQMHEGIREFGEYSFTDEGAGEIMDLGKIAKNLRSLEPATAVEVLKQVEALISVDWKRKHLLADIVLSLDEWDEIWETHGDYLENH
jgi:hypothetical protein|tara:strand:- start:178 stop:480 length:303 start_codon:yes stop_codon:yes gene_type:complete